MADYYYLASLLPPLAIGHVPPMSFLELKELFAINLNKEDQKKVRKFLTLIDMENLRAFWAHEPHDNRGNYTKAEIEHSLEELAWPNGQEFPSYLKDFVEKYKSDKEKVEHFSFLMSDFLKIESEKEEEDSFLSRYFAFERDLRLVLVGFRAKKLNRDLYAELQFEDPSEPIIAEILAQKDAPTYEPPFEFKDLKPIFFEFIDSPLELHKALLAYSFNYIEALVANDHFSIDRILGFMARLLLVEKWLELDMNEGLAIIRKVEGNIQ